MASRSEIKSVCILDQNRAVVNPGQEHISHTPIHVQVFIKYNPVIVVFSEVIAEPEIAGQKVSYTVELKETVQ